MSFILGDSNSGGENIAAFVPAGRVGSVVRMGGADAAIEEFLADVGVTGASTMAEECGVEDGTGGATASELIATCTPILLLDFGVVCTPCDLNTRALGVLATFPLPEAMLPPLERDPRELGVVLPPCGFDFR